MPLLLIHPICADGCVGVGREGGSSEQKFCHLLMLHIPNSYTEQKEALTLFPSHFFAQRKRRNREKTTVERKPTRAFDGGRASVRGETKFVFPGGGRKTEHIMPFDIGYCLWLRLN